MFDEAFFLYEKMWTCASGPRAGWRVVFTPAAEIVHHLGASMAQGGIALEYHRSHLRFYAKHHGWGPRLVLRGALAARGGLDWLTAHGPRGAEDRRDAAALLRLVLGRE